MKKNLLFFCLIVFSAGLSAQNLPALSENSLVQKKEFRTKAGWTKISLDARFRETGNESLAVYFYYEFVNLSGQYNFTHTTKTGFPDKAMRIVYENKNPVKSSKILNGTIDFYDKTGHRNFRYVFKEGFLIHEFDFVWGAFHKKYTGKLKTAFEFVPYADRVEMRCNSFDSRGQCNQYAHEMNDGKTYTRIPGIPNVSLDELNIGKVWKAIEEKSYRYNMFIDTVSHTGKNAACIASIGKKTGGSGGLAQQIKADAYAGKRIRISAYMKTENINGWAGLWVRIDQAGVQFPLSSDNMRDRPVKGTNGWTKYEIVLDVPSSATTISFGAMLHGEGQIWFDDFVLETVDQSVKITGTAYPVQSTGLSSQPAELDFEK